MIDFYPLKPQDRNYYQSLRRTDATKGCEFSFNNLFMWGNQKVAFAYDCALIFSEFDGFRLYPCPVGTGDRKAAVEAIIADAKERGLPFRMSGLDEEDRKELESLFPGKFLFRDYRNSADYVYDIHALADMKGRKLQKKRNHVNKFLAQHPAWETVELTKDNLHLAMELAEQWYREREAVNPDGDYEMEKVAMDRAFRNFHAMEMEGLLLMDGGEVLAFTMGSRMYTDTFDTHFEKAREQVEGAYAMINREFARHLREKYPELRYIDREDDMGLPGLRQAKLSYAPDHLIEKGMACLAEEGFEDED